MKKYFIFASLLIATLFFVPEAHARIYCSSVTIDKTTGTTANNFTIIGTRCTNTSDGSQVVYKVLVENSSGEIINTYQSVTDSIGKVTITVGGLLEGNYKLWFFNNADYSGSIPTQSTSFSISVNDSYGGGIYTCGELVPEGTTTCPDKCPYRKVITETGTEQFICGCSLDSEGCCPLNNVLDLPLCRSGLVCATDNICKSNLGGSIPITLACSERVQPSDYGFFRCSSGCDARSAPGGGLWCSCGGLSQSCCPTLEEFLEEPGTAAVDFVDNGAKCNAGFMCNESIDTCVIAGDDIFRTPVCVAENGTWGLETPFGCISMESTPKIVSSFVDLAVGIGGGITLILSAYAAFIIITSQGDPKRINSAKELLGSSLSGLLLIILCAFILRILGINILGLF